MQLAVNDGFHPKMVGACVRLLISWLIFFVEVTGRLPKRQSIRQTSADHVERVCIIVVHSSG